jgi:hypothetical protein
VVEEGEVEVVARALWESRRRFGASINWGRAEPDERDRADARAAIEVLDRHREKAG